MHQFESAICQKPLPMDFLGPAGIDVFADYSDDVVRNEIAGFVASLNPEEYEAYKGAVRIVVKRGCV